MATIAAEVGIGESTVSRILQRHGPNRLSALDPKPPVQRYEHATPGSMPHLDIKKPGRFACPGHRVTGTRQAGRSDAEGWDYGHVAIDDHARVGFARIWPDESAPGACNASIAAVRYCRRPGITIERGLTDNGACYRSYRLAKLCRRLGIRHKRTRPYTPRTNGKAERFIQTALRECAYAHVYANDEQRAKQLPYRLHHYNWRRPHGSLNKQPPISRLELSVDNPSRLHN